MSRRSGPPPLLIVVIGALVVFGGYYVWTGFLQFLEEGGNITAPATRQALSTATAQVGPMIRPTVFMPATFTPLPPCQMFRVTAERAVYRDCPSQDNQQCPIVEVVPYDTELCVYSRSPDNPEWYVIELNPGGAYRDIVFMHESVIKPVNPTPTDDDAAAHRQSASVRHAAADRSDQPDADTQPGADADAVAHLHTVALTAQRQYLGEAVRIPVYLVKF